MTEFDLRALVRHHLELSDDPDPTTVWTRVVEAIPEDQARTALAQVGAGLVTEEIRRQRNAAINASTTHNAGASRWRQHGATYKGLLASRVATGDGWKFLADCTRDDLLFAIGSRRAHAAAVLATADFYQRLLDQLDHAGARTVGELPHEVLEAAA